MSDSSVVSTNSSVREVVIIGSGPSGCTAAIYTARALLRPLLLAGYTSGGQLMLTSDVENFPGYRTPVTGPELMEDLFFQASRFGAEIWRMDCLKLDLSRRPFEVRTANGTVFAKAVIISTGAEALWLQAPDEERFRGKGISTCATCDGFLFRNKCVVVIGGGDSAMEEANFLTRFAKKVTVIHRNKNFRASKIMLQRARDNPKITLEVNKRVNKWLGNETTGLLSGVELVDTSTGVVESLDCDGAFIAIGHRPNIAFLDGQIALDSKGYVSCGPNNTMTSVPGVFACGDVMDSRYKQAITAAGSGCQAAIDAERWLEENHSEHSN
eukprot:gene27038-35747_t